MSGTQLLQYTEQMRETYDYAFMYTCLAVGKTSESVRELVKEYFSKLGYCLIEVSNDGVEVVAEATPRKVPRSERDYNEVVSRGLLYIATRQVLLDKGYGDEELNITSQWVGLKRPINYYGILLGDHAVIGFYARGLDKAKRLLSFLRSNEGLVESLAKNGYRMYLESYMVVAGVRGYMRHFDEPLNLDVVKSLIDKLKLESKPKQTSKQGSGIK